MSKYFSAAKIEAAPAVNLSAVFAPATHSDDSAIDEYYRRSRECIARSSRAEAEGENELSPLIFLRLISATESYVRRVLSELPFLCPLCRSEASKGQVSLGAGFYYARNEMALGVLEHAGLSSKGEISKQTKKVTGFVCESDASLREAIAAFESVSQLRHAIVHAYDRIYYNNLVELGLVDAVPTGSVVTMSPLDLQRFASVCHALVRSFNRAMLDFVLINWIQKRVLVMAWPEDAALFSALFDLFRSKDDQVAPPNAYQAFRKVMAVAASDLAK